MKKFGLALYVTFSGTDEAVEMFARIHGAIGDQGYGIELPEIDQSDTISWSSIGKVRIDRVSQGHCNVCVVERPRKGLLSRLFGK